MVRTLAAACVAMCIVAGCSSRKGERAAAVVVVGTDTMSIAELARVSPDSALDSSKLCRLAGQVALARLVPTASKLADTATMVKRCAEQVSLRSGSEWGPAATASLLEASATIKHAVDSLATAEKVAAFLDSTLKSSVRFARTGSAAGVPCEKVLGAGLSKNLHTKEGLAKLIELVLGLSDQNSRILADFVSAPRTQVSGSKAAEDLIKGLVFDEKQAAKDRALAQAKVERSEVDNSEKVLNRRGQQSILDTINRHHSTIQALYKKSLKTHQDMAGTVVVRMRLSPAGAVIEAGIEASQIADRAFLREFLDYVKTMRFASVPDKLGNMTFTFPFEFTPEG